jgi:hypothetical protein
MTPRRHLARSPVVLLFASALALVGCDTSSGVDAGMMGGGAAGGRTTGGGSAGGSSGGAAGGSAGGAAGGMAGGSAGGMADAGTPDCAHSVPASVAGFTTITFSESSVALTGFGGAEDSQVVGDPECGPASANRVLQVGRSPSAMTFAGTTVSTVAGNQVPRIALSAGNALMSLRTRSPVAGIKVRLKIEDAADPTRSVETEATTTVANAWETLTFDFSRQALGTAAVNFAFTYNRATVFFDFGTAGSAANARAYFADDLAFIGGGAATDGGMGGGSAGGAAGGSAGGAAGGSAGGAAGGSAGGAAGGAAGGSAGGAAGGSADAGVMPFAVFVDDLRAGTTFAIFDSSVNANARDTTVTNNGRASYRVVGPSSGYTGGALVSATPVDLRAYNVITFWARASATTTIDNLGFGDTASPVGVPLIAEFKNTMVGTGWARYVRPIPNPSALSANTGLFFFAGIPAGVTVWFNDIQFEALSPSELSAAVGAVTNVSVNWPAARNVPVGTPFQLDSAPNTVFYTTPTAFRVGWRYFNLVSSNPGVATVNPDGLITAADAGMTVISAAPFGGFTVPGSTTITVPGGALPTAPMSPAMDPGARPANQVVSLYTSSNIYATRAIDTFGTPWSNGGAGPNLTDFTIGSGPTARVVKRYASLNFVGWESLNQNPYLNVPGSWTLHFSLWTSNATTFSVKLVTFNPTTPGGMMGGTNGAEFQFNASNLTQGQWVELNIPLSAFTGVDTTRIGQIIIANNTPVLESGTFFLDNIYFFQ